MTLSVEEEKILQAANEYEQAVTMPKEENSQYPAENAAFDILFNGWIEYRTKIKGWPPLHKIDIIDWENWKQYIFSRQEQ